MASELTAGRRSDARVPAPSNSQLERERLVELFRELVEPLGRALPLTSEVVLHDLRRLPHSIVAVQGDVTGRRIGDPATDVLLERATAGTLEHMVGYTTRLPDGRALNSTTMVIRDSAGLPVAALCINSDLSMWESLGRVATGMTGARDGRGTVAAGTGAGGDPGDDSASGDAGGTARTDVGHDAGPGAATSDGAGSRAPARSTATPPTTADARPANEVFVRDVDELASHLITQAIREQNVPVELMRKEHKVEVVRSLRSRGMFQLRDAVETVAASLLVTRFTIYNYLNEIGDQVAGTPRRTDPSAPRRRS